MYCTLFGFKYLRTCRCRYLITSRGFERLKIGGGKTHGNTLSLLPILLANATSPPREVRFRIQRYGGLSAVTRTDRVLALSNERVIALVCSYQMPHVNGNYKRSLPTSADPQAKNM